MSQPPFVILDRDGTLIVERHYLSDPEQVKLLPRAASGLRQMLKMEVGLVIITNQSAIGRGLFDEERLTLIHQRLKELLDLEGIHLNGIYFCPHTPEDNCFCRKPAIGLMTLASKELEFEPQQSFVIGDKSCDIELGKNVGATTLLVRTGYGSKVANEGTATPDYIVNDLWDAAHVINELLSNRRKGGSIP